MSLDDLIQENYDRMNANDHRVWQYICRHREECRKMPLHQLADACEVSPATVLRFLKLINMDGYSDFKAFLKWDSLNKPVFNQHSIEQNSFNLTRSGRTDHGHEPDAEGGRGVSYFRLRK